MMSSSLSLSLHLRLEDVCTRFEAAWQSARTEGPPPCLADHLGAAVGPERTALLRELILLDRHYRCRRGENPGADYYAACCPTDAATIHLLWTELLTPPQPPRQVVPTDSAIPGCDIRGRLGEGGMGEVVRGHDRHLDRDLAIKVLLSKYRDEPHLTRRFLNEARILGRLQHPGIVPIHELGELPDRRPYFTMKVVEGRTLADLLQERAEPRRNLARFLTIFEQVCQAVAYAHSQGVIHRDLKPQNVMVGAFGEVQVMDWGLAKVLNEAQPQDESAGAAETVVACAETQTGAVLGTYAYMPPEQARGEVACLDRRCDVFGLGAILCEILTGQPPYAGTPEERRTQSQQGQLAPALRRLALCGADAELIDLATGCLSDCPADRPTDAGAVADAMVLYQGAVQERLRTAERERATAMAQSRALDAWIPGWPLEELLERALAGAKAREAQAWATAEAERRGRRLVVALMAALAVGIASMWGLLLLARG
jgi:tRNA A-37 threonylcarbamoyl transferase component Bud32